MQKSHLVIASIIGIFVTGISGMLYANNYPTSPMPLNSHPVVFDPRQSIEISGLEPVIDWQKPIEFSILAHKFSGCTGIDVRVFREYDFQPPVLEKQFITQCNDDSRTKPREYSFPIIINSTSIVKPGKYVVKVSYYADRSVYGDLEKTFEITKSEFLRNNDVVPRDDLFLQQPLRITGLNETYHIGQKIEFTVKFNGTGYGCGYPELRIEDSEHQKVWQSGNTVHSCDPDMKDAHIEKEWQIGDTPLGTPMINKTGFYTLFVTFGDDIIQKNFWVKSHSDVEIIGLEDTYKVGDNVRFYVTVQGFGMIPCDDFTVSIKNDHGQTVLDIPAYDTSCQIPVEPENYEFYFPQKNDSYVLFVNQTGKYTVSANFGADSLEKEFVVKENNQIK